MQIIRGVDLMLFVDDKSIASATNHTLTISSDTEDINTKDTGFGLWTTTQIKSMSWTVTSENLISTYYKDTEEKDKSGEYTYTKLFDLMVARQPLDITFAVRSGVDGDYTYRKEQTNAMEPKANDGFKGKALITNITYNANVGDNASMTIELSGCGGLYSVDKYDEFESEGEDQKKN